MLYTLKNYYRALKPDRTYANVMTTAAGFLFACAWHIDWGLLAATIGGTTLVVLSACAANNCTDRGIDARMPRTRKRPTVTGEVSVWVLATLAVVLGIAGYALLLVYTNWLTVLVGAIAYIDYVVLYGWSKRTSVHSTLIGTISGAAPLVAGYTAVTGRFDVTALILALIMIFWQMPHFYAIGIFRLADYKAGGLPVWPVVRGIRSTQYWILVYTSLYLCAVLSLALFGHAGAVYAAVSVVLALYWLWLGVRGLRPVGGHHSQPQDPVKWARGMFGVSLVVLLVLSASVALSPLLP